MTGGVSEKLVEGKNWKNLDARRLHDRHRLCIISEEIATFDIGQDR